MFRTQYLDYAELTAQLSAWATAYPDYVSVSSLGQSAEGRDILLGLVRHCDVVLENFRPDVMDRLGLSAAANAPIEPPKFGVFRM